MLSKLQLSIIDTLARSIYKHNDYKRQLNLIISKLNKYKSTNNETIGISAEWAMEDVFGIPHTKQYDTRINSEYVDKITGCINSYQSKYEGTPWEIPTVSESLGYKNKKSDFMYLNGDTMSLKTLQKKDGKICPQITGQPTINSFDTKHFSEWHLQLHNEPLPTHKQGKREYHSERFEWIRNNIKQFISTQLSNVFCCNDLILISNCNGKTPKLEFIKKVPDEYFNDKQLIFTRDNYEELWNEKTQKYSEFSTTIKMTVPNSTNPMAVGELQFHKGRAGIKFRFCKKFLLFAAGDGR
mgnify:CR=1 FL=1